MRRRFCQILNRPNYEIGLSRYAMPHIWQKARFPSRKSQVMFWNPICLNYLDETVAISKFIWTLNIYLISIGTLMCKTEQGYYSCGRRVLLKRFGNETKRITGSAPILFTIHQMTNFVVSMNIFELCYIFQGIDIQPMDSNGLVRIFK